MMAAAPRLFCETEITSSMFMPRVTARFLLSQFQLFILTLATAVGAIVTTSRRKRRCRMIEMLRETGHYPAFVASCIGGAIGLGMILFGLIVKLYCRYF